MQGPGTPRKEARHGGIASLLRNQRRECRNPGRRSWEPRPPPGRSQESWGAQIAYATCQESYCAREREDEHRCSTVLREEVVSSPIGGAKCTRADFERLPGMSERSNRMKNAHRTFGIPYGARMRNHEPLGAVRGRRAAAQAMAGHKRIVLAPMLENVGLNIGREA